MGIWAYDQKINAGIFQPGLQSYIPLKKNNHFN
jgi:hypothetical protein